MLGERLAALLDRLGLNASAFAGPIESRPGSRTKEMAVRDMVKAKRAAVPRPEFEAWLRQRGVKDHEATADFVYEGKKKPAWWLTAKDSGLTPSAPTTGTVLDHRTPALGIRPVDPGAMPIVDPEAAIDGALADVRAGRDPTAKLEAAKALLQALKAARRAGLAGVLIAGAWGSMTSSDMPDNAKIRREDITKWADLEAFRGEDRKRRMRTKAPRETGT